MTARFRGVWGQWFSAVWALALLGALVAGVPYLLVTIVGNPFPSSLPSPDELRILLTQNGQGFANFILGTLAILIWAMWLQLMVALAVEIVATIRRSESRRLPLTPGIQSFAARLIAALTLATTLAAAPLLTSTAGALDLGLRTEVAAVGMDLAGEGYSAHAPAAEEMAEAETLSGTAKPRDIAGRQQEDYSRALHRLQSSLTLHDSTELWDLAESAYGDGVMWKTIAAANAGRVDASGQRITENTEVVAQGTELMMPGDVDSDGVLSYGAPAAVEVVPGDSMWTIAEAEVEERLGRPATDAEVAEYWSEVVHANQDVASGDVDLIHPGELLTLPGTLVSDEAAGQLGPADGFVEVTALQAPSQEISQPEISQSEVSQSEVSQSEAPSAEQPQDVHAEQPQDGASDQQEIAPPELSQDAPQEPEPSQIDSVDVGAVGLAALGASLLCMGAVGALRRRRDRQRRTRTAGTAARRPSTEAAAFEAAMRHASDELRESELDAGWRAMPASVVDAMREAGPLQIHAEANGVLRAVAVTDGNGDAIDSVDLSKHFESGATSGITTGAAVAPTTLIIGTDRSTGEAVLLDLASVTRLRLDGSPVAVRRFARSAIVDLAVSERADDLRVIAVGVGRELIDFERVLLVDDFAEAMSVALSSGLLGDPATPLIVVSTIDPGPSGDDLADRGVIVVAPGVETTNTLMLDGDTAELRPAGTQLHVAALSDDHYRSLAELVDVTSPSAVEPVVDTAVIHDSVDVSPADECPIAVGPIDVRVLGPVEVVGAAPFSSLKAVDVIAYLSFHRHGVDADQIKSWVWPTFEPPTDKALANVMSRARTGLGADDDGEPYLSRAGADKTYRLSLEVTTDFDRFRALVALADDDGEPTNQLNLMKRALELIRGVPFTGGSASSFAWADNHVRAQVEFTIDETVHRCADLALELGDVATARWSALKGLELVPGCEQCFRRRFLVARADNNRSELRRAMADLERSAALELGEPEAIDTISSDLLDLYHQLDSALVGDAL